MTADFVGYVLDKQGYMVRFMRGPKSSVAQALEAYTENGLVTNLLALNGGSSFYGPDLRKLTTNHRWVSRLPLKDKAILEDTLSMLPKSDGITGAQKSQDRLVQLREQLAKDASYSTPFANRWSAKLAHILADLSDISVINTAEDFNAAITALRKTVIVMAEQMKDMVSMDRQVPTIVREFNSDLTKYLKTRL